MCLAAPNFILWLNAHDIGMSTTDHLWPSSIYQWNFRLPNPSTEFLQFPVTRPAHLCLGLLWQKMVDPTCWLFLQNKCSLFLHTLGSSFIHSQTLIKPTFLWLQHLIKVSWDIQSCGLGNYWILGFYWMPAIVGLAGILPEIILISLLSIYIYKKNEVILKLKKMHTLPSCFKQSRVTLARLCIFGGDFSIWKFSYFVLLVLCLFVCFVFKTVLFWVALTVLELNESFHSPEFNKY